MPGISTIILSMNDKEYLRRCLKSYILSENPPTRETIIVDNGSKDGTIDMIDNEFPGIRLVINRTNRGVARARNQGIREAKGDYILFLDSDSEIKNGTIRILHEFMERQPEVAVAAPKIVNTDGSLQHSARRFPTPLTFLLRGLGIGKNSMAIRKHMMKDEDMSSPREIDWAIGACLLVRKSALYDIGLFDEKYFFGYDDSDMCYRMHKNGWKIMHHPEAVLVHHYQRRSARGILFNKFKWIHARSAIRFFRKRYLKT